MSTSATPQNALHSLAIDFARSQGGVIPGSRAMIRALMRGSAEDLKLGYSARSAAYSVLETFGHFKLASDDVFKYAEGFAAGMRASPPGNTPANESDAWRSGFADGAVEGSENGNLNYA